MPYTDPHRVEDPAEDEETYLITYRSGMGGVDSVTVRGSSFKPSPGNAVLVHDTNGDVVALVYDVLAVIKQ